MNNIAVEKLVSTVITLLNGSSSVTSLCPRIFRTRPSYLGLDMYPYIEFGDCTEIPPSWDMMGRRGHELTLTLSCYAINADNVSVTALQIADAASKVILPANLNVPGYGFIDSRLEFNEPIPDLTGTNKLIQAVSRYRIWLEEA